MGNSGSHWHPLRRWMVVCCATVAVFVLTGGAASARPAQDAAAAVIIVTAPDGTSTDWVLTGTTGAVDIDPAAASERCGGFRAAIRVGGGRFVVRRAGRR